MHDILVFMINQELIIYKINNYSSKNNNYNHNHNKTYNQYYQLLYYMFM